MTDRPRYPRSSCCVIGCHRRSTLFPGEWMCADHWRSLPPALRQVQRRAWRRHLKAWEVYDASHAKRPWQSEHRARAASQRLWNRAKRIATEKAAGL